MKKVIYIDIGELGWSLYLSAHMRWLKENTDDHIGIMTFVDRHCLYNGIVNAIYDVPDDFHKKFRRGTESRFGLKGTSPDNLKKYFTERIPSGYEIGGFFGRHFNIRSKAIFEPYAYSKELNGRKEILVFPRHRIMGRPSLRNLSSKFYAKTIVALCKKYPDYIVRTMGIPSGAYSINGIERTNYVNDVREGMDLQEIIDRCQVAIATVGSQSAPPKLALLQGVPTFMIGHQRARHVGPDNWMSTKNEFYDVVKKHYGSIDTRDCIGKIISFIEECHHA
ncbi:MAG: hypothetical protein E3J87_03630 [Candidatus Cloacimonadota bacterium]|nr:MAG: hypothetical protein E3J87_03630 [Candidatus Cloacimonadota bacterium]